MTRMYLFGKETYLNQLQCTTLQLNPTKECIKSNFTQKLTNEHAYDLSPAHTRIISLTTCYAFKHEAKILIYFTPEE